MNENYLTKVENKPGATENVIWLPPSVTRNKVPVARELVQKSKQKKRFISWGFADKEVWDWLLLISQVLGAVAIPFIITVLGLYLTQQVTQQQDLLSERQHQLDLQLNQQQRNSDQVIALDQQQETTMKTCIDDIKDLVLNKGLATSKPGDEVRVVARAEVLSALRQLNGERKGILIQFLSEARLVKSSRNDVAIDLTGTNLHGANLHYADLVGANLTGADLTDADLRNSDLTGAILTDADLHGSDLSESHLANTHMHFTILSDTRLPGIDLRNADLTSAYLDNADLGGADLRGANLDATDLSDADLNGANLSGVHLGYQRLFYASLRGAKLTGADLTGADLWGADLWDADLAGAQLTQAQLMGADLTGADLTGADLSGADLGSGIAFHNVHLKGARVTTEQLSKAKSLQGTIMPDGTKHS